MLSIICGLFTGKIDAVSGAVMSGGQKSIQLVIELLGMMCFWTGLMRVAEKSGATKILSNIFTPLLRLLFPKLDKNSPAAQAMAMNLSSNLLGLGNAATPFGITAMKELKKLNDKGKVATNEMIRFIVLNTASLQLIPTTLTVLRTKHGSANPTEVLPAIWLTSVLALAVGLIICWLLERRKGVRHE